jgi:uncharacterized membrane protein
MKKSLFSVLFSLFLLSFTSLNVFAQEDVFITSFNLDMQVDEYGLITAQQSIDTQFNINGHGIYAYIPQDYQMTWMIDGESIDKEYYFPVNITKIYDRPYEISTDDYNNVLLQIGDPDTLINGPQRFEYDYTLQMRDLDLEGQQAFYLNIVGSGWEMPMEEVSFSITLPSAWPTEIEFYVGAYGSSAPAEVEYTIVGNTLSGHLVGTLNRYEALTIYAPLPSAPFTFIPPTDYTLYLMALVGFVMVLVYLAYLKFGKDDPLIETVEFYPPVGYSSAMVGFVYEGIVDTKDILSLIIEWAHKGYLKITELEKEDDFILSKLKDIDTSEIRAEQTLFRNLFNGLDEVSSDDLKNRFYTSIENAKQDIYRHFQGVKQHNIFDNASTAVKVLLGLVVQLPIALLYAAYAYLNSYNGPQELVIAGIIHIILSGISLLFILTRKFWPSMRTLSRGFALIGLTLLSLIVLGALFALFSFEGASILAFIISAISFAFNTFMISIMDKRTPLGTELLGKVMGLKHFIEVAEKEKLEALVHDDPTYFYQILPYAYVLNVSDTWSKKFESIVVAEASWYVGPHPINAYLFHSHLYHTLGRMNTVMTSVPQGSGKGGGSFGGGGGFSGGGFGGGGGGHW